MTHRDDIVVRSVRWSIVIALLWGVDAALDARSASEATYAFVVAAAFGGSLTLICTPSQLRSRRAVAAGLEAAAIPVESRAERRSLRKRALGVIMQGHPTTDPTLAPTVLAITDVLQEPAPFESIGLPLMMAWIAFFALRGLYRSLTVSAARGALSLIPITVCLFLLFLNFVARTETKNSIALRAIMTGSGDDGAEQPF